MKNIKMKKLYSLILSFSFIFSLFTNLNFVNASENYDYKGLKVNIETDKCWVVKFNLSLDKNSVTTQNLKVTDENENLVSTTVTLRDDLRSIEIVPNSSYTKGKTYNLYILTGLKSKYGATLSKSAKMQFTIKEDKPNPPTPPPANDDVVCIDAGHGMGRDIGSVGINGLKEDDVTLSVSLKVGEILKSRGVNVVYTRTADESSANMTVTESLQKRCDISNNANAKYFVCIHCNAFDLASANGSETFYFPGSSKGELLAQSIQTNIVNSIGTYNRGLKDGRWLYVVKNTVAPSVLVELGFLTNPLDAEKLSSDYYRGVFAQAIANGILKNLGKL